MEPQHDDAQPFGAVSYPVVRSSTFTYPTAEAGAGRFAGDDGLLYGRLENPTVAALERRIAALEGAEACLAFASGMAAIHATLMSLLTPGSRIVVDPCVYGCTYDLLNRLAGWGVDVAWTETTDPGALEAALEQGADVLYVETPMNPTLRVVDLQDAARRAHAAGAVLVVDNTFASPAAQRPLAHGADLVVESLTKSMGGHSDVIAGAVSGSAAALEAVWGWRKDAGGILGPDDAWLVLRGLATLELRTEAASRTARAVAEALETRGYPVRYPGLPSHPDHAVVERQMPRGGSILTVDLGTEEAAFAFQDRLRLWNRAVSLGGVESLVSHPASTTHATMGPEDQARAGITPGLVRLSAGVEGTDVLLEDLLAALPRRTVEPTP